MARKEQSITRTPQSSEFESWLKEVARADPVAQSDLISVGDLLVEGRFEVRALIGRGGMGSVYEVWDERDQRLVALKTLRGRRPERLYRLKREFRAIADIRHENLVKLWELHRDGSRWFFTMERLHGDDIRTVAGAGDLAQVRSVVGQLASGLAELHDAGLVHRDVKPSNAMLLESGRVVLLDLGLVADVETSHEQGEVLGTEAYMAPEQAAGAEPTSSADLYSLGVLLFELITGSLPSPAQLADPCGALAQVEDAPLSDLCVQLLGPPQLRPAAVEVAFRLGAGIPVEGARVALPLVGRQAELEFLWATLKRIDTGIDTGEANAIVEIRGDSGQGKTALLREFCTQVRAAGLTVLAGRCREREQVPFNALDSIIDGVVASLRGTHAAGKLVTDLGPLARLFPALGAVSAIADPAASDAPERADAPTSVDRHRAFDGLAAMLAETAGGRALCLAIDDAQWADSDSVALLKSLLASEAVPLLVVAATGSRRTQEESQRLGDRLGAVVLPLELEALDALEARALSEKALAAHGGDLDRATQIAIEAQGVPLYIRELAMYGDDRDGEPEQLGDMLRRRLDDLEAESTAALRMVCIAGTVFTREMLVTALGSSRRAVAHALDVLERGRFVRGRRRRGETGFEPYHQRISDAVLASMPAGDRVAAHRDIANAIAAVNPDDAVGLTYHWRGAGAVEKARHTALDGARSAYAALAFDRAAELFAIAIELGEPATAALHTERGEAFEAGGRGAAAAEAYRQAAMLSEFPRVLERRAAEQLLLAGHIDEGIEAIGALLAADGMPLPVNPLWALLELGVERARLWLSRRRGDTGDVDKLESTWALAVGLSQVDPVRGALYQARHLRLALASGDPTRIALGLCADAMSAAAKGAPAIRAHELLDEAARISTETSDARVPAYLSLARAQVKFLCGDFSLARDLAGEAAEHFASSPGARWEQSTATLFHLTCLWHTGRLTELCSATRAASIEARALGDRYGLTQLQTTVLPPVHLLDDRPEDAESDLAEAWESWSRREMFLQHWQHLQATALVHLYRGEPTLALEAFETRFVGTGRFILSQVKAVRGFTAYVRGIAAVGALAQRPSDRDYERSARRDIARLKREDTATVALIEAQLHYIRGEHERARLALERGITAATTLDLQLIAACARRCFAHLGGNAGAEQAADDYFASHPIARPDRIVAMLMPAFARLLLD